MSSKNNDIFEDLFSEPDRNRYLKRMAIWVIVLLVVNIGLTGMTLGGYECSHDIKNETIFIKDKGIASLGENEYTGELIDPRPWAEIVVNGKEFRVGTSESSYEHLNVGEYKEMSIHYKGIKAEYIYLIGTSYED